ncbi:MAG: hypothetical protein ACUVXI_01890 [bacterium]
MGAPRSTCGGDDVGRIVRDGGEMLTPIKRFFERRYPLGREYREAMRRVFFSLARRYPRADIVYIGGRIDRIHAVKVEVSYDDCFAFYHGVRQLRDYKANYRWLALPLDEYERDGSGRLRGECERRGFGILVVFPHSEGLLAQSVLEPEYKGGNFGRYYPRILREWHYGV